MEQASGNAPTTREHSKASEQDKVQWLNERLAHSVMDLSRAKAEQNSPAADKGRWVQRQETELESYIYIAVSDLCYRNFGGGGGGRSDGRSNIQGVILRAIFGLKIQQRYGAQ